MAKYEDPNQLDYRNGGDTVDDFAQKYMRTIAYVFKALNDLRTPTGNTAGVEPEPYMWRIADNKLYIRNADNTDYILLGEISPNFGFRQSVNDRFLTTADLEGDGAVVTRNEAGKVEGDITGSPGKIAGKTIDVTPSADNDVIAYDAAQQKWVKKTLNDYLKKQGDAGWDEMVDEVADQVIEDITPIIFNFWYLDDDGYLVPLVGSTEGGLPSIHGMVGDYEQITARSVEVAGNFSATGNVTAGMVTTAQANVTTLTANAVNAGTLTANDIIAKGPVVDVRAFGSKGDGVTDDTAAIQAALNESMLKKVKLIIPSGTYLITTSLIINKAVFIEGWGNAVLNTANDIPIIKFYGTTSDEYALKDSIFRNVKFDGPGTTYGANASGYGIKLGEETDTNTLHNIPMVRIENCSFTGFNKGVYIEGYGHTLKDNYFADCLIGLEIIHPEQVYGINNWIQYCDLGLAVNNAKLQYGHEFMWYGGAIQRNKKGAQIYNFYDIYMNIYCEQNTDYDVTFGKSGGDYNYGCKNIHLNLTTTQMSNPTSNSYHVGLFASVSAKVEVANWNTTSQDLTTVKVDGYSKFIDIYVPTENEPYTTPYDITGNSQSTTFIHKNNKTYVYNNDLVTEHIYKYWSNKARLIEKTGAGGKIISIPKGDHSLFAVLDGSNDNAIFQVANNSNNAYFAVTANAKMKMKAGATITLNGTEYNMTTTDGETIKLVAIS